MSSITLDELLAQLKLPEGKKRSVAWLQASDVGAPAITPLVAIVAQNSDLEISRAAMHALWQIVRYAGRPDLPASSPCAREAVVKALLDALKAQKPLQLQRDVMWMLSEIAGDEAIAPMAARLKESELREDARAVLQRLPGDAAVAALREAYGSAPADFKPALADALRHRDAAVPGAPSLRLTPTRKTGVKPVGR